MALEQLRTKLAEMDAWQQHDLLVNNDELSDWLSDNAEAYLAVLIDVAEVAERVVGSFSNAYWTIARREGKTRTAVALNDLHDVLGRLF